MSKGNNLETDLLALIFNATAIPNVADNASASPITQLAVALHTADPGEAGTMATSEAAYTGYARVNVNRNSGGWTVAAGQAENTAEIAFAECTAGSATLTHFSIGYPTGDEILYSGALDASLAVSSGISPTIAAGALTITED
jgi:hypothetical protein